MVDARSYVTTQTQQHPLTPTPKQQETQTQMGNSTTSDLQRRAVEIAAESMAALFASKRVRLVDLGISVKDDASSTSPLVVDDGLVQVQESALKRQKQRKGGDADDDGVEEQQCIGGGGSADGGVCPRRSFGSDHELESDGASSSAPEQRKMPQQSEQPVRKVRVRKPTYAVRKEEKDVLQKQVQQLEAQIAFLKERAGTPIGPRLSKLGESLYRNDMIREALRQQHLGLANAQSAVLECLNAQQTNPMSSYIRLGTTWHDRRATLLALKDRKVRDAYEYVMARARALDPLKPHVTDDRFEDAAGDYCCVRFEMTQFTGVESVQQVFEALQYYLFNMEISISEKLGHVTTRDDYGFVDKSVSNHRLLSTEHGIEIELNGVMFAQFFENHGPSNGNPCGVIAVDSVDVDELHPYATSGRIRKDISATCVITHHTRKKPDSDEDELVVVMTRGAFLRLHHSDVVVPPQTLLEVRDGIARWGHAMLKCMHDILYPEVADSPRGIIERANDGRGAFEELIGEEDKAASSYIMESTTAALRSLNTTFVRKGIVAASTGDHEPRDLPNEVLGLLENLKSECQGVCENARDVGSFIQLWKERSLHQTLQALDDGGDSSTSNSHEKQIQAIEMHERAGREMNELLQRHRKETTRDMHSRIDLFAEQLTVMLTKLIKPELEDELEHERAMVRRLVQEKQRLDQAQLSLQQSNQELSSRIDSLENAPNGGGDAILCNKLRERVQELTITKHELLANVADMEKEREKHRWDMVQMKQELETQQRMFFLTKAMHEKETKQLVVLVQNRQAQFAQVMQRSSTNGSVNVAAPTCGGPNPLMSLPRTAGPMKKHQATTLEVYDPTSGRTIQYAPKSPQKPRDSASSNNRPKTGFTFTSSPPASPKRKLSAPSSSINPNQQQRGSLDLSPLQAPSQSEVATESQASQQQACQSSSSPLQSPNGHVRRFVFSDLSQKSF